MISVGIDAISLYTPHYYLPLTALATERNLDPNKFTQGLGQTKMAVPGPDEDIITMASNAAHQVMQQVQDKNAIELVIFATESGIDHSKAAGLYVQELLGLSSKCRVIEVKQACYSATAMLQLCMPWLAANPDKKALLIASDIARYGLNSTGESSQGAAAVAMILATNPRILAIDPEYGISSQSIMDFWRPTYLNEAIVDGKYSSKVYLTALDSCWQQYYQQTKRACSDFAAYCYHTPVPKLVETAHWQLMKKHGAAKAKAACIASVENALAYNRLIGNSYSASLYVSLISLLDHRDDLANQRIGLYSYGSGYVAEFFSGSVQPDYQKYLLTEIHQQQLNSREALDYQRYTQFYEFQLPKDGSHLELPKYQTGLYRLACIDLHQRKYEIASGK